MKSFRVVFAVFIALVTAAPASAQLPDNSLIRVTGTAPVYRVVGGAPIWLSDCAYIPEGCGAVNDISSLAGYRPYPSDGVTIRNYAPGSGAVYRFAGGAPLWLSKCVPASPCPEQYQVDYGSLDPTKFSHARQFPLDGTVVRNVDDGGFYRFAGGAPLVTRCDIGGSCVNPPTVDNGTFAANGTNGSTPEHLHQFPADGTTLYNLDDGSLWRVAGGAPLKLGSCDGCAVVNVDNRTFQLAGTATTSMPHLRFAPVEGTFLKTGTRTFRVAGAAAVPVLDCAPLNGCPGAVSVDDNTIASLGGGYLLATPRDGTVIRGLPSGQVWEISGGKRRATNIQVNGVDLDDAGVATIPLDVTVTTTPPIITPAFSPLITGRYNLKSRRTRFTALSVRNVPAGATVVITCKGKGCPYKKKTYTKPTKGRVDAIKSFRKAKLRAKAVVTVTVTAANGERKITKWTMRATKLPKRSDSCAPPGGRLKKC